MLLAFFYPYCTIGFSTEKVWREICSNQAPFTTKTIQSSSKQIYLWMGNGFFHWRIMDLLCLYHRLWNRSNALKVKCLNDGFISHKLIFLLHKTLINGPESWGLLVDYCDVFISSLNSHSDGTHSHNRINWLAFSISIYLENIKR